MSYPNERRAFVRFPIPTILDFDPGNENFQEAISVNLSEAGAFVEGGALLPVGVEGTVLFVLPNLGWAFQTRAKVIWTREASHEEKVDGRKDEMGWAFLEMDGTDREKLQNYMQNFKLEDLEL